MYQLIGLVFDLPNLLEDDALFAADIGREEARVEEHIAEEVDGEGHVLGKHPGVVAGRFLIGEGVQLPADGIQRLCDIARRARSSPLEQHVLQSVADAGPLWRFMHRPDAHPDPNRSREDVRNLLGQNADPVG